MKLILTCFVIILLRLRIVECQRFTSKEMLSVLKKISAATAFNETEKCLPVIEGKLYPDLRYSFVACDTNQDVIPLRNFPNETQCFGFQCWESQLTDRSRLDILEIMNTYRISVAQGTCGPRCENNNHKIVFELRWSNLLEHLAIGYISNCKDQKNTSLSDSIQYNNESGRIDYVAVSFEVKEGFQQELRLIFRELLTKNYLNDWDEKTEQFRRGLAIDVGCAYILRYGVYMVTSLNETVNFGNVGHLCCVFGSPKSSIALNDVNASSSACSRSLPGFNAELSSKNSLYHSLCRVIISLDHIKTPSLSCQFDRKIHEELFDSICPAISIQNNVTWSEKVYGFFLKFRTKQNEQSNQVASVLQDVECNLPSFPETWQREEKNEHNADRTCKQEVVNEANSSACQGWFCDESQLTDESRRLIVHSVNRARNFVAQGICTTSCKPPCMCNGIQYCNVVEIHWHWYLELKAIERIKNCPNEYSHQKVFYFNTPFLEPVYFEEVILVFDLPPEGQIRLDNKFTEFFWANLLYDWNPDGMFRRGNSMWMGCAIVVRPSQNITNMRPELKILNGLATHMVCIYASLNEDFGSKKGSANTDCCPTCIESQAASSCRFKMRKNSTPYPYLCKSDLSPERTKSCAINKCKTFSTIPSNLESIWEKYAVAGYTLRQYLNDSLEQEHRLFDDELLKQKYVGKICDIGTALFCMVAVLLLLIISLIYKHNAEQKYYAKLKK